MDLVLLIQGCIIAIVQGITEFLPVSSTGHMILVGHLIGFESDFSKVYEIFIQLGTILAVPVLFRKRFLKTLRHLKPGQEGFVFWSKIALACVPAGLLGLLIKDVIDQYLMYPLPVAFSLIIGSLFILGVEYKRKHASEEQIKKQANSLFDISYKQAIGIGVYQCLALWPGFSRSAATIMGGCLMGLNSVTAAEFSFFLAMPMMVLTSGYSLYKSGLIFSSTELLVLGIGFFLAFIVAIIVIAKFVKFLQTKPFTVFAYYRLVIGMLFLVLSMVNWL